MSKISKFEVLSPFCGKFIQKYTNEQIPLGVFKVFDKRSLIINPGNRQDNDSLNIPKNFAGVPRPLSHLATYRSTDHCYDAFSLADNNHKDHFSGHGRLLPVCLMPTAVTLTIFYRLVLLLWPDLWLAAMSLVTCYFFLTKIDFNQPKPSIPSPR